MDGMGNANISFCKEKLWGDIFGMRVAPARSPSWHPTRADFYTTSICCEQKYLQILVAFLFMTHSNTIWQATQKSDVRKTIFLFNWMTFKNQVLQVVTLFWSYKSRPFHGEKVTSILGNQSRSRMEEAGNRSSRIFFPGCTHKEI